MNHPRARCLSSSAFRLTGRARSSIGARNDLEGPVTKRRQFVSASAGLEGPRASPSTSRRNLRFLRSYENTRRIMDLDRRLLAVSTQTNDRIHPRPRLSRGKRKTAGPIQPALYSGFLVLLLLRHCRSVTVPAGTIVLGQASFARDNSPAFPFVSQTMWENDLVSLRDPARFV